MFQMSLLLHLKQKDPTQRLFSGEYDVLYHYKWAASYPRLLHSGPPMADKKKAPVAKPPAVFNAAEMVHSETRRILILSETSPFETLKKNHSRSPNFTISIHLKLSKKKSTKPKSLSITMF